MFRLIDSAKRMPKPPEGVIFARKKDIPVEIRYFCGSVNFYKKKCGTMRKVWLFVVGLLLCATTVVSGKDFRFALISDLHVSPGSIGAKDLQLAVDQINATPGLDFVIVSGDVHRTWRSSLVGTGERDPFRIEPAYVYYLRKPRNQVERIGGYRFRSGVRCGSVSFRIWRFPVSRVQYRTGDSNDGGARCSARYQLAEGGVGRLWNRETGLFSDTLSHETGRCGQLVHRD